MGKACLFVLAELRFYSIVNPLGSCRARSVYITTFSSADLVLKVVNQYLFTFFCQKLTTALLESVEGREIKHACKSTIEGLFVCVEVLWLSQPSGVMSSVVT